MTDWDDIESQDRGYRLYVNKETRRKFLKTIHRFIDGIPEGKTFLVSLKYEEMSE